MPTYHVIPHTHWDREWYLSFEHFRVLLVHMMDDLLEILEQKPAYESFLLDGQTVVVEDYLEIKPDRRAEIERLVREGRLSAGPWYVLPDEFLVSGESIIRNLARGRRMARELGAVMDVGYIPDSFGHIAQMPQILRGFGIDAAIVWRGFGGEEGQESSEYIWKSPDGSSVLMEHLPDVGYSAAYFNSPDPDEAFDRFDDFRKRVDFRANTNHRLMLSGGDHHWPYAALPELIDAVNDRLNGEAELRHSTLTDFIEALRNEIQPEKLPVAEGEFCFGYRWAFNVTGGVYSARMYLKQANARAQWLLERVLEPLNAIAVARGHRSRTALIEQGWKYLLQNHPHDSICGCSIDPVHREMMTRYEKIEELGKGVERMIWNDLVEEEERAFGDDASIVFFNPSPFSRNEVVQCDVEFFRQRVVVGLNPDVEIDPLLPSVESFHLVDDDGKPLAFEVIERKEDFGIAYGRFDYPQQTRVDRFTINVAAGEVPALGFKAVHVRKGDAAHPAAGASGSRSGENTIENPHLTVRAAPDGSFAVTDRATGEEFGPLGYFEDGGDEGDEYNYSPPDEDTVYDSRASARCRVEVVGDRLRRGLRVEGRWSLPLGLSDDLSRRVDLTEVLHFTTTAWLTHDGRSVTFETTIHNNVEDHRLRAVFETGCRTNHHHADGHFGVISREQKEYDPELFWIETPAAVAPMHRFVTMEGGQRGATVFAAGLPEYELKYNSNGVIALTLLRCVGQLARGELNTRPGGRAGWQNDTPDAQCPGDHSFRYAFMPHGPGWSSRMAERNRAAESFHLPIRWTPRKRPFEGRSAASFVAIAPESLVLSALKEADDGNGLILRVCNPTPDSIDGQVRLGFGASRISRVNLEEAGSEKVEADGDGFSDSWPAFRIQSYRVVPEGGPLKS